MSKPSPHNGPKAADSGGEAGVPHKDFAGLSDCIKAAERAWRKRRGISAGIYNVGFRSARFKFGSKSRPNKP
jgi:hypothetical protein